MVHSPSTSRQGGVTVIMPPEETDPLLCHNNLGNTTPSTKETCKKNRHAIQRALGFKNVVIYVLLFLNFALLTRLGLTYSRQQQQQQAYRTSFAVRGGGGEEFGHGEPEEDGDATWLDFWLKMALIVILVMIGGIFAGLTIGLMGLDETNLHVLMASGSPTEQVHAEIVFTLLSRGKHWVLVTLLLGNVIVNETLPVVLDSELGGGVVAILISTMLIVIFGEIIPQAVCARYGLAIGSYCAKPMMIFMYIMSPIAYPIAMLLDSWLGIHHGTTYRRTELKTLVSLHQVDGIGELTDDEVTIIASVLDLKEKSVSQIMTPLEDVFTLSEDAILDEAMMEEIFTAGYSRIPIYRYDDASNFIGMLLVKRLITYDPEDHIAVRQFTINSLPGVAPNTSCLDILNFFQEGRSHMAMVTSEPGGFGLPVGVITLEDVIEELLGEEIVDESDVYVDVHNKIKVIRKPNKNSTMFKNLKNFLLSPAISHAGTPLLAPSGGVPGAGVGAVGRRTSIENQNHCLATGKTILQPRKTSVEIGGETQPLLGDSGSRYEYVFKAGSFGKDGSHLSANLHHQHPTLQPHVHQPQTQPRLHAHQEQHSSLPHVQYPTSDATDGVHFKENFEQRRQNVSVSPVSPLDEAVVKVESPSSTIGAISTATTTTTTTTANEPTTTSSSGSVVMDTTKSNTPTNMTPVVPKLKLVADEVEGVVVKGAETYSTGLVDGAASPAPSTESSSKKKKKKKKSTK
ncbi:hypothetical protein BGZ58_002302 [Dissophora ornata]|nr:hypothetical protein BGZ58_002302 [Dissophora ornata]